MIKLLALFPGVGAQYPGMGRSLYAASAVFRQTLEEAGDVLGRDLAALCLDPDRAGDLDALGNAQLAVLATGVATYRVFRRELDLRPDLALGHSLGEYTALCCAGALSFADALSIVARRERLIREVLAGAGNQGTMMWVINPARATVEAVCREVSLPESRVYVSAYDHPGQHSISGHAPAVASAAEQLQKAGAIVYPLRAGGPWHCPLMAPVTAPLHALLEEYTFRPPAFPVLANLDAESYPTTRAGMIATLARQLESPLRLAAALERAVGRGAAVAVDFGPKDVMKFLARKNAPELRAYNLEKAEQLDALREALVVQPADLAGIARRCLRAINTTPNRNPDPGAYRRHVVAPYRALEARVRAASEPGLEELLEIIRLTADILEHKALPQETLRQCRARIWDGKLLPVNFDKPNEVDNV